MEQRGKPWIEKDPYRFDPPEWKGTGRYPCVIGIFTEFWHLHWPVVAACRELGVSYKLLDITGRDWLEVVERSGCDGFIARPSVQIDVWKQMYEERLYIISKVLHKTVFPTFEELWLYESKRRMYYWLEANQIPHATTWLFYRLPEALDFAEAVELPVIYKSNLGSGSSGVILFRDRAQLRKHTKLCFGKGFTTYRRARQDRDWRYVLFQEYVADAREWRMIRLGDSYFGHQKQKKGDFHSGSGLASWEVPSARLLDFVREVTDKGRFRSMDLDILQQGDKYFISELQTWFGWIRPYQMVVDGKAGRHLYDNATGKWLFEEGIYCQNGGCNLRVAALLSDMHVNVDLVGTKDLHLVRDSDKVDSRRLCEHNAESVE
jgi:hypothetical protein